MAALAVAPALAEAKETNTSCLLLSGRPPPA
jgi:hypothetical protein